MKRITNKRTLMCAAIFISAFATCGCGQKKVDYGVDVINGDSVAEYSGSAVTTESSGDTAAGDVAQIVGTDSVGGLVHDLSIPENAHMDLPTDGTELKKISIDADTIKVPEKDKMYTKEYYMGDISADDRRQMLEAVFDEDEGVFNYPYDDKDDVSEEQIAAIFADKGADVDYSSDRFIGKIDGREYKVLFTNPEWSTDVGFHISTVGNAAEITDELSDKGATMVGYTLAEYLIDEEDDTQTAESDGPSVDVDMPNKCDLTEEQIAEKARAYAAQIGLEDVVVTKVSELYMEYMDDYAAPIAYEKDGFAVDMAASVNAVSLYQPQAFGVDTISHNSTRAADDFSGSNYYYSEGSHCTLYFSAEGLLSISCEWPMRSAGDLKDAGSLLTWDEALESLKSVIPEHFKDYVGYSDVTFNDVRLTYFRTYEEPGKYQAIPVYSFAEIDDIHDDTYPIQLIMLDARDGSEVDIRQDESRMNAKN